MSDTKEAAKKSFWRKLIEGNPNRKKMEKDYDKKRDKKKAAEQDLND